MFASSYVRVTAGTILIGASVLVGLLSYFRLAEMGSRNQEVAIAPAALPPQDLMSVTTARRAISRGEVLGLGAVATIRVEPPGPPGAVERVEDLTGAVALYDIPQGQIITETAVLREEGARPGLSILVPPGYRAVALRVNDEIAVGNFVRPNDRVDIQLVLPGGLLASARGESPGRVAQPESSILLQNVLVLSTGETLASIEGKTAIRMHNITVAVSSEDALLLALAKETGKFYLALRHPADEVGAAAQRFRVSDLLEPQTGATVDAQPIETDSFAIPPPPVPDPWRVQIYRGLHLSESPFALKEQP